MEKKDLFLCNDYDCDCSFMCEAAGAPGGCIATACSHCANTNKCTDCIRYFPLKSDYPEIKPSFSRHGNDYKICNLTPYDIDFLLKSLAFSESYIEDFLFCHYSDDDPEINKLNAWLTRSEYIRDLLHSVLHDHEYDFDKMVTIRGDEDV